MPDNKEKPQNTEEQHTQPVSLYTRVLLIVVIVLGIFIVAGFTLVVTTIVNRLSDDAAPHPIAIREETHNLRLDLPVSAQLIHMQAHGRNIVLHIRDGETDMVIFVDPKTGHEISRITIP